MSPKVTPLDQRIGKHIAELRRSREVTQPMVARVLGITYQSYQKIERGLVSIRVSTLLKIAEYFSVPVGSIIDGALRD
jgi:DNA-binding XRE family transcriptional regulator